MKTLIKILCLSVLWFSCESEDESEDAFVEIYHLNMDIMMRFSHRLLCIFLSLKNSLKGLYFVASHYSPVITIE